MMSRVSVLKGALSFAIGLGASPAFASAGITYFGRLVRPDGSPVSASLVNFRLQVRTPGNENCLMFEETQSKDLSQTGGVFSITINDGSGTRTDGGALVLPDVFSNRQSLTFDATRCSGGITYNPSPTDGRRLVVYFNDGSFTGWEPLPVQSVNYVPYSLQALAVGGFAPENLIRIEGGTVTPLSPGEATELVNLAKGLSTTYLKSASAGAVTVGGDLSGTVAGATVVRLQGRAVGAGAPASGDVLKWDGTSWSPATDATAAGSSLPNGTAANQFLLWGGAAWSGVALSSSHVTTALSYTPLNPASNLSDLASAASARTNLGLGTAATRTVGTAAGHLVELNGSAKVPAALVEAGVAPGGSASGDLGGSYPNPSVTGLRGGALASTTPQDGQIYRWNNTATEWQPVFFGIDDLRTAAGAAQFSAACTSAAQTLTWSAVTDAFTCTSIAIAHTAVSGLGSAATRTAGTAAGNVLELDGSGKVPASALGATVVLDGGNAAGATMNIGATTNNGLNLLANNVARMTIAADGSVGIGTTAPTSALDIVNDGGAGTADDVKVSGYSNTAGQAGAFVLTRSRGSVGTPGAVQGNDLVGTFQTRAHDGSALVTTSAINTRAETTFTTTASTQNAYMAFSTVTAGSNTEKVRITSGGAVGIGTSGPAAPLHVGTHVDATLGGGGSVVIGDPSALNLVIDRDEIMARNNGAAATLYLQSAGGQIISRGLTNISYDPGVTSGAHTLLRTFRSTGSSFGVGFGYLANGAAETAGMIRPTGAGSDLAFANDSGAEQLRLTSAGRLGVGTTTPSVSLDLGLRTDGVRLPNGTDAQRPVAPANGLIRYNTTNSKIEVYENGAWANVLGGVSSSTTSVTATAGSAASPSISFGGDADTGFFNTSSNDVIGVAVGGGKIFDLSAGGLVSPTTGGAAVATANGSATTPTYSFAGDADTGWFRAAADTLAASTAGVERMRIDPTGQVGIGTSSPAGAFHVYTSSASYYDRVGGAGVGPHLLLRRANGTLAVPSAVLSGEALGQIGFQGHDGTNWTTAGGGMIRALAAENWTAGARGAGLSFMTTPTSSISATERLRIADSGKIGIGTGTPDQLLTVSGTENVGDGVVAAIENLSPGANAWGGLEVRNDLGIIGWLWTGSSAYENSLEHFRSRLTLQSQGANSTGVDIVSSAGAGDIRLYTGGTTTNRERVRILSDGKVGIGTTAPSSALEISGISSQLSIHNPFDTSATRNSRIDFKHSNGIGAAISAGRASGASDGMNLAFFTQPTAGSATQRMVIDPTGNIGIATGTPTARLDVSGTVKATAFEGPIASSTVTAGAGSAGSPSLTFSGDTNTGWFSPAADNLAASTAGSERVRINELGNVGIGTTSPATRLQVSAGSTVVTTTASTVASVTINNSNSATANNHSDLVFATADTGGTEVVSSKIIGIHNSHAVGAVNGHMAFMTSNAGTLGEAMRITATNNVGIGTTAPSTLLQIGTGIYLGEGGASGAAAVGPDIRMSSSGIITAGDELYINIDADNDSTTNAFVVAKDRLSNTGGTELFRVQENGNFGIGTAAPSALLHIYKASATSQVFVETGGGASSAAFLVLKDGDATAGTQTYGIKSQDDVFSLNLLNDAGTASVTRILTADATGKVGIGTSAPLSNFHLESTGNTVMRTISSAANTGNAWHLVGNSGDNKAFAMGYVSNAGDPQLRFNFDSPIGTGSASNILVLKSNGTVGIGTNATDSTLTLVEAGTDISALNNVGEGALVIETNSGDATGWKMRLDTNEMQVSNNGAAGSFAINPFGGSVSLASGAFVVSSTGNVGIGVGGAPAVPLDIAGNSASAIMELDNAHADADGISIKVGSATPSASVYYMIFRDSANGIDGSVRADGAGGVMFNTTSDGRLKENIGPTKYGLKDLLKVRIRDYNFIGTETRTTGVIAQELHQVFPEAVNTGGENPVERPWGVDYGKLTTLLTAGVQELHGMCEMSQRQLASHGRRLASLERSDAEKDQEIRRLRAENADIKARLERLEKLLAK